MWQTGTHVPLDRIPGETTSFEPYVIEPEHSLIAQSIRSPSQRPRKLRQRKRLF